MRVRICMAKLEAKPQPVSRGQMSLFIRDQAYRLWSHKTFNFVLLKLRMYR